MTTKPGRREQQRQQTRAALQAAADRLFAERGYAHTTVRDIADAAGVTERTFFRYFSAKEELAVDAAVSWIEPMLAALRARPREEDVLTAVRHSVVQLEAAMRRSGGPTLLSLYADRVPAQLLRSIVGRRAQLRIVAIEAALAPAVRERLVLDRFADDDLLEFRSQTLSRTIVAVVRSALLHDFALRTRDEGVRRSLSELLEIAFDDLKRAWRPPR